MRYNVRLTIPGENMQQLSREEWKSLPEPEQRRIASSWDPQRDGGGELPGQIELEFRREYDGLPGLVIHGGSNCHGSLVLGVTHRLIFDRRQLPEHFLGMRVYSTVSGIPDDFRVYPTYVWAPENWLHLVDNHADQVRTELGNPDMPRDEMLRALVGMEFEDWIEACRRFGPGHTDL